MIPNSGLLYYKNSDGLKQTLLLPRFQLLWSLLRRRGPSLHAPQRASTASRGVQLSESAAGNPIFSPPLSSPLPLPRYSPSPSILPLSPLALFCLTPPLSMYNTNSWYRCMKAGYCGPDCQKKHWPYHKLICSKNNQDKK